MTKIYNTLFKTIDLEYVNTIMYKTNNNMACLKQRNLYTIF